MTGPADFNTAVVEEFRANRGVVGGPFEGRTVLLLHTTGARSGAAAHRWCTSAWPGRMLIMAAPAGAAR